MPEARLILGVGELLWDIVPAGGCAPETGATKALLGGAPANFAVMAARLGDRAEILSRVGRDELGRRAIEQIKELGAGGEFLQIDPMHETGRVTVNFHQGQPHYTIHQPAAWDSLEATEEWLRLAGRADAIAFGSLAQRSRESRATIQRLLEQSSARCIRVFDANLRSPFYSGEILRESLALATAAKLNEAELPIVLKLLGLPECAGLLRGAQQLLDEFPRLELVAATRGAGGALLVNREEWNDHSGVAAKVADTIGAGDAFTAALVHQMLRGAGLAAMNEAGNRWGAWMASQAGAMPPLPSEVRARIEAEIAAESEA